MMMKKFRYRMSVGVVGLAILASSGCTSSKTSDNPSDLAPAADAGTDAVPMDPAAAPPTADAAAPTTGTDAPPPSAPAADDKTASATPPADQNPTTAPPVADTVAANDKTPAAPSDAAPARRRKKLQRNITRNIKQRRNLQTLQARACRMLRPMLLQQHLKKI
jgi:hypothetical protein